MQEAFGDAIGNTYQFAGKQLDPESGFYYFGARYYDPRTGIFETPDPALAQKLASLPEDPSGPSGLTPSHPASSTPITMPTTGRSPSPTRAGPRPQKRL